MELVGKNIRAILKSGKVISGILIECEKESIHIQKENDVGVIITIPSDNIDFYESFGTASDIMAHTNNISKDKKIAVFIDEEHFIDIPIPSSVKVDTYNDDIGKIVFRHPDVVSILQTRTQKHIEYYPEKIYIQTMEGSQEYQEPADQIPNSFSIGGPMASSYLSGPDMAMRLDGVLKKRKTTGETK